MSPKMARNEDVSRAPALIPAKRFDAGDLPPKQWIEAWHETCDGFYDVSIDEHARTASQTYFTWHRLDNLIFSSGISHPHRARRTSAHIRRQRRYVRLLFSRRGGSRMIIDDQAVELRDKMVYLIDYSRPFVHLRDHHIELDGVYVPHDELGYDSSRHPAITRIGLETPTGQVLAAGFYALQGRLPEISMSEAPTLAVGFRELVRALVLRDRKSERGLAEARSTRREAMRAHIERNLREPSLGVDSVARAFSVSCPTVYRDFGPEGGVAHYIMARRLERAFIDLADHPPTRGAVREVSESWGFESMSHFNHRFRARFGVAPGEVVGVAAGFGVDGQKPVAGSVDHTIDRLVDRELSAWFASTN